MAVIESKVLCITFYSWVLHMYNARCYQKEPRELALLTVYFQEKSRLVRRHSMTALRTYFILCDY